VLFPIDTIDTIHVTSFREMPCQLTNINVQKILNTDLQKNVKCLKMFRVRLALTRDAMVSFYVYSALHQ
jgi:hypothetical protein